MATFHTDSSTIQVKDILFHLISFIIKKLKTKQCHSNGWYSQNFLQSFVRQGCISYYSSCSFQIALVFVVQKVLILSNFVTLNLIDSEMVKVIDNTSLILDSTLSVEKVQKIKFQKSCYNNYDGIFNSKQTFATKL